ncbi:MAG: glycerol-3-phosphate dehydrogenase/oxidase [Acidimicrobiales bacterium]|nr:glycerol-3-phosphate dehydrogenase/oxidase [Acidimicrobiales bacterium]
MTLGTFDRARSLQALGATTFDVLVVGGGITGAGVALDAASRGLRTALVERDDFASGTSSRSSKLVHGGLRYLQNGDVRLVYEALRERQRLRHNAPHLVRLLPFLIPLFSKDGLIHPKVARALGSAMWMYDLTGGARIGKLHKRLKKDEAVAHMPTIPVERLAGAYLYYDAAADDARLTLTLARTAAVEHGAVVANHTRVVQLLHDAQGKVRGAAIEARQADGTTTSFEVAARSIVNAAGVWSDDVRALDEGQHPHSIRPAKGIHITVPWEKVQNDIAVVVPVPKDKRSVFVVPWLPTDDGRFQLTYIGTTDTDYDGPLDDPRCTPADIAYLLSAINLSVRKPLSEADVVGTWAGLRPLVNAAVSGRTADLSRRHKVLLSASGMVSVTGGKLTTYREMAEDTVDAVVEHLGDLPRTARRCQTRRLRLLGAGATLAATPRHLADRYGSEARVLTAMVQGDPRLGEPLVDGLPYLRAEAVYAVRHEMARTVDDVLSRRTRARLQAREASVAAARDVAALLGAELDWSPADVEREAAAYTSSVAGERAASGLPEPVPPVAGLR